jgi:hypothetical protein
MVEPTLTQWIESAHDALTEGRPLTVRHIMALASQPERHDPRGRRTWWSEEMARIASEKVKDAYPGSHATNADVREWQRRQEYFDEQMADLATAHAEALALAAPPQPRPEQKKRRHKTLADDAIAIAQDHTTSEAA